MSPHTKKLRTRDAHIWGIRRLQPNQSAMEGPQPGETAYQTATLFILPPGTNNQAATLFILPPGTNYQAVP